MANYFYDASALVKRYHTELGSNKINQFFEHESRHFIAELTVIEIHAAFSKKRLMNELATDEELQRVRAQFSNDIKKEKIAVIRVHSEHYRKAEGLVRKYGTDPDIGILRSLDALQLAVALDFSNRIEMDCFLSSDRRQCDVAAKEGLNVINPELEG